MDEIQKKELSSESEEEKSLEEEVLSEHSQDDVRASVIEKYGLDEESQSDLVDAIVADTLEERKKLSTAIKQKRTWREKATQAKPPVVESKPVQPTVVPPKDWESHLDQKVKETLERRDLESLDVNDDVKEEVKTYAKVKGISVREAFNSPYIKFRKDEIEQRERVTNASIGGKRSYSNKPIRDYSNTNPKEFDQSTEQGRKDLAAWKEWVKSQG